jgi:hypothetical protein
MLLVDHLSCAPDTDQGVTLAGHGSTLVPEVKGKVSFFGSDSYLLAKARQQ